MTCLVGYLIRRNWLINLSCNNKMEKNPCWKNILTGAIIDKCLKIELSWYTFIKFFTLLDQNDFYFRGKLYFNFNTIHCKSWTSLRFVNEK